MLISYEELFNDFSVTVTSFKNFFHTLFSLLNSVFVLETDISGSEELLQYISEQRTCFGDIFLEMKIIRCVGSERDIKACDFFERRFDKSVQGLSDKCLELVSPPVEEGTFHIVFILDRDEQESDSTEVVKFEHELGKYFSIPQEAKCNEVGGQLILMQVPEDCSSTFVSAPLHGSRILALKNQKVQFARYKEHKMFLSKWNVYHNQDITLGETLYCNGHNKIISVSLRGSAYMALQYSPHSDEESDEDYIQYLENVLNYNYKNIPAIKGLHYLEENQNPLLIMEKGYPLLDGSSKFPLEEVNQVSVLLDLVNCINDFIATDEYIKIKIYTDAVYLCQRGNKLVAKLCPMYGYTFLFGRQTDHEKQFKSLPVEDLHWMSDVIKYLQFGNGSKELPENHILKKLLYQKWLSKDDYDRPRNYELLLEDLRDLHGNNCCFLAGHISSAYSR